MGSFRMQKLVIRGLMVIYFVVLVRWIQLATPADEPMLSTIEGKPINFHLHVLLMGVAFPIFTTEALISFVGDGNRFGVDRDRDHRNKKRRHVWMHLCAILSAIIGVMIAFANHQQRKIPHLYSIHSWFGVLTIAVVVIQASIAVYSFGIGNPSPEFKAWILPSHRIMGQIVYNTAIATVLLGLLEMQGFTVCPSIILDGDSNDTTTSKFCAQKMHLAAVGLLAWCIAALATFTIGWGKHSAQLRPQDENAPLVYYGMVESDDEL